MKPAARPPFGLPGGRVRLGGGCASRHGIGLARLAALSALVAGCVLIAIAAFVPAKAALGQILLARAWDRQVATGEPARPWPWADFTPAARLDFPDHHRSVLALTDAAGESLAFGPTLMAASARPGTRGVAVFAAHRDTHFAFLGDLQRGDLVAIDSPGGQHTFRITGAETVRWDASGIEPFDGGAPRIALVTCWPLDGDFRGPLRYVVWGELASG